MLGEQELLSEAFGKLHERVCRLECVFPRIDGGNYEHYRVERDCAAVTGIQNCGTEEGFDEFLKKIVKYVQILLNPDLLFYFKIPLFLMIFSSF